MNQPLAFCVMQIFFQICRSIFWRLLFYWQILFIALMKEMFLQIIQTAQSPYRRRILLGQTAHASVMSRSNIPKSHWKTLSLFECNRTVKIAWNQLCKQQNMSLFCLFRDSMKIWIVASRWKIKTKNIGALLWRELTLPHQNCSRSTNQTRSEILHVFLKTFSFLIIAQVNALSSQAGASEFHLLCTQKPDSQILSIPTCWWTHEGQRPGASSAEFQRRPRWPASGDFCWSPSGPAPSGHTEASLALLVYF